MPISQNLWWLLLSYLSEKIPELLKQKRFYTFPPVYLSTSAYYASASSASFSKTDPPSQNVAIVTKLVAMSLPNNDTTFYVINLWADVNLYIVAFPTKQTACSPVIFSLSSMNSLIMSKISASVWTPLVSPNPGVSMIIVGGFLTVPSMKYSDTSDVTEPVFSFLVSSTIV